jgi:hypothetical protein
VLRQAAPRPALPGAAPRPALLPAVSRLLPHRGAPRPALPRSVAPAPRRNGHCLAARRPAWPTRPAGPAAARRAVAPPGRRNPAAVPSGVGRRTDRPPPRHVSGPGPSPRWQAGRGAHPHHGQGCPADGRGPRYRCGRRRQNGRPSGRSGLQCPPSGRQQPNVRRPGWSGQQYRPQDCRGPDERRRHPSDCRPGARYLCRVGRYLRRVGRHRCRVGRHRCRVGRWRWPAGRPGQSEPRCLRCLRGLVATSPRVGLCCLGCSVGTGRLDRPGRSGCLGPPSGRSQSRTRAVVRRTGPSNRRPAARARSRPPSAPSQASHARRHTGAYNVKPFRTNGVPTHGRRTEGRYQHGSGPQHEDVRRRPTLPRGPPRSTIGAEGLNFRVRNGTGCFPFAMATETLWRCQVVADRTSGTAQWTHAKSISRSQATRPISTGQLHTSPCFHLRPINPVV